MLRYKSGNYGGVNLQLDGSHNGSFAAIKNQDGIAALNAKFGLKSVANINTKTLPNYPGNFRITNPTDNGWEEYYSQSGILPSYVYKYHGQPIMGWILVDGIYWCSPAAQIDTPIDQEVARNAAHGSTSSGAASAPSGEDLSGRPKIYDIDKRAVSMCFIELLNEYRESLGVAPLEVVEEQMKYAQERADRDSVSHEGNTAAAEVCCTNFVLGDYYETYGSERAIAKNAFDHFRESSAHDTTMKSKKYTKVGAGFLLVSDSYGGIAAYTCETNFEK